MSVAASKGILIPMLTALTTGESQPLVIPITMDKHTFYIRGNGAVGAGAVQISTADDPLYTGTWAPFGTPVTVPANGQTVVNIPAPSAFAAFKVSLSTPVTGGTATVSYLGG